MVLFYFYFNLWFCVNVKNIGPKSDWKFELECFRLLKKKKKKRSKQLQFHSTHWQEQSSRQSSKADGTSLDTHSDQHGLTIPFLCCSVVLVGLGCISGQNSLDWAVLLQWFNVWPGFQTIGCNNFRPHASTSPMQKQLRSWSGLGVVEPPSPPHYH